MKKGFTLIELLIVIAVLGILTVTVISAINPIEQINRSRDTGSLSDAEQLLSAIDRSYTTSGYYPWKLSPRNPLSDATAWGPVVNTVPGWDDGTTAVLTKLSSVGTGEVKASFINRITSANYNTMYKYNRGQSGDNTYICFLPKSEDFKTKAESACGTNGSGLPNDLKPIATNICEGGPGKVYYYCIPYTYSQTAQSTTIQTTPLPPTNNGCIPWSSGKYALDDTKFLRTYAVVFFPDPGFNTYWDWIDVSLSPDFGPGHVFLHTSDTNPSMSLGPSYVQYSQLTKKFAAFFSQPYLSNTYTNSCGKTIYWRVTEPHNPPSKISPTYTSVIDCDTKVGVVDPPLSWFHVYDQINNKMKVYDPLWDFDCNGTIDWTDYWIGAFSTKTRYGGWSGSE
jgi:prepilin-type N-terminal cleavage/methylation domain-containing protein